MPEGTLLILCEGDLENAVIKQFLQIYWSQRFSHCEVVNYGGAGNLKTKFASDAFHELTADPQASVLCLIDLYEEPFAVYDKAKMSPTEGFIALREVLLARMPAKFHPRFGAFPVVMEPETWLLADSTLQSGKIGKRYSEPENIDHPTAELERRLSRYKKLIDGTNLFARASAKRVYEDNCPHFIKLVDWLITPPPPPQTYPEELKKRREAYDAKLEELMNAKEEAWEKSEDALRTDRLDEAIKWEDEATNLEAQINEHSKSMGDIFSD